MIFSSILFGILFLVVGSFTYYTYSISNKVERVNINREDVVNTDVINIALFRSDYSDYYNVSSADSTMLLSIDTKNNKIKISYRYKLIFILSWYYYFKKEKRLKKYKYHHKNTTKKRQKLIEE